MNLKLKRIAPLQAGKMLAAFYGLMSLLVVPFMMFFLALSTLASRGHGGPSPFPFVFGLGMGIVFALLLPFFYALMGFVFGVISAWLYNLLARWIGGFELEFEPTPPPRAS
jgi:hypothetical protein